MVRVGGVGFERRPDGAAVITVFADSTENAPVLRHEACHAADMTRVIGELLDLDTAPDPEL